MRPVVDSDLAGPEITEGSPSVRSGPQGRARATEGIPLVARRAVVDTEPAPIDFGEEVCTDGSYTD